MFVAKYAKDQLMKSINTIIENREQFVVNPETDFTRKSKLSLRNTMGIVLSMTNSSLEKELYDYIKRYKTEFTVSAFVQRRSQIKPEAFQNVLGTFTKTLFAPKTFNDYMLYAVDGTKLNIAHNPNDLDTYFVNQKDSKGYNQLHINALYDLNNKTYVDCVIQPGKKMNEHQALCEMVGRLSFPRKTIIIADRGYESFNNFATLLEKPNVDFVIRTKHGKSAIKEIKKLPMEELDQTITLEITTTQTNEDKRLGRHFIQTGSKKGKRNSANTVISTWNFPSPYRMTLRVVRLLLSNGKYETLITSLPASEFSIEDMRKLYAKRWEIETSFRHLKYPCGLIYLHSKKKELIHQEIYATLIIYNYCHFIAAAVVVPQKDRAYLYKINFTMAIKICRENLKYNEPPDSLIQDIGRYTEPIRPERADLRKLNAKKFIHFLYRAA